MPDDDTTQIQPGPQIQRREAWADLPEEYAGFKVKVWVNAPTRLWNALVSKDNETVDADNEKDETVDALRQLVLAHNHWRDFDGQEYPPANTAAFWEEIPTELAACILIAAQREIQKLPNSMAPQRRRSQRGSRQKTRRG